MAKKVIIAMSGGVDSSVAAALLKKDGFDVVGVFMKFWADVEDNGLIGSQNKCCSPEAEKRARKVASILGIPFCVFNFEKEFKEKIVDSFLSEYKKGRTPNPCVVCNKEIKFGLFLEKALSLDADFVATGHYARLWREFSIFNFQFSKYKLLRAKDKEKDQSYFLWRLNQEQLAYILFPVGGYTKVEVKKIAKKLKLPVLDIPESVEICFVQTTINDFLKKQLKTKPGKIIDEEGKTVGGHEGLWFYTIGQRKGIGLAGGPYWVLNKDVKENLLIVTKNEKELYKKALLAKDVNWISDTEPRLPLKVKAKIRYRHTPVPAVIVNSLGSGAYNLEFDNPQRAVTLGQSVVFYKGQELLGGGVIK